MMSINAFSLPLKDIRSSFVQEHINFFKHNKYLNKIIDFCSSRYLDVPTSLDITSEDSPSSLFQTIHFQETIDALNQKGMALNLNLNSEIVEELQQLALGTPCYDPNYPEHHFYASAKDQLTPEDGKSVVQGIYDSRTIACATLRKLERDPLLLAIARTYLNAEPIHQNTQLWWSFAMESTFYERRQAAQRFSQKSKTPPALTFYFYLTDVDLCSNPHVCVQESHLKKKFIHRLLNKDFSLQEINHCYGYQNISPICGKAGFGFVTDTRCFHKKISPSSNDRLTLEVTFSAKPSFVALCAKQQATGNSKL